MAGTNPHLLQRGRSLILGVLLALAAIAWVVLIWQSAAMNQHAMGPTMGMSAMLFIALWVAMMIAMMFPTAAPMILMFRAVYAGKRQQEQPFVPTWIFVSAYLLVWSLCGVVVYLLAVGIEQVVAQSMWFMQNSARLSGAVLMVAGLYQLSTLKHTCLSKCRTPLQFILGSWRDGYAGAFRMGVVHGAYCLGCCWLLFVILFALGIMNVAVMALVTVLIYAEKSLSIGPQIGKLAGAALIAYGVLVMFVPGALPTAM